MSRRKLDPELFVVYDEPSTLKKTRTAAKPIGEAGRARQARMATARNLRPCGREATCGMRPSSGLKSVDFVRNANTGDVRADGCHVCGSLWTCPICAANISETRCQELQSATRTWIATGNCVLMATLTVPHLHHECLDNLYLRLKDAMARLRGSRAYKDAMASTLGVVRAVEVTYGEANGWHPHFHILIFQSGRITDEQLVNLRLTLSAAWQKSAVAAGFSPPDLHIGCNLVHGVSVEERLAAYLAKMGRDLPPPTDRDQLTARQWGAECELSKWHTKRAKGPDRFSPFALLDAYQAARKSSEKSKFRALWLEYASAMKGQRQLVWSRGLKDALRRLGASIGEQTDEEAALPDCSAENVVAVVSVEEWRWIVGFRLAAPLLAALSRVPSQATADAFRRTARDRREALRSQRWRREEKPLFDILPHVAA